MEKEKLIKLMDLREIKEDPKINEILKTILRDYELNEKKIEIKKGREGLCQHEYKRAMASLGIKRGDMCKNKVKEGKRLCDKHYNVTKNKLIEKKEGVMNKSMNF